MFYELKQISINLSPGARKLIFISPLIIGSLYACRKIYLYFKISNKAIKDDSNNLDVYDYSLATTNSLTLTHSPSTDNLDGCAFSTDIKKVRSALSTSQKCSSCRNNQKLSFRESNVYDISLKNFSTGQLLKFGFEGLNNSLKALEELKFKQSMLQEYIKVDDSLDTRIFNLLETLNKISVEYETIRNELMPATYSNLITETNEDDFDDQASFISSATTTSLGYWDPEPNLHFFILYQDALKNISSIEPTRTDRTVVTGCENYDDFLAKVHCLRLAFAQLFTNNDLRDYFTKIGDEILRVMFDHSLRSSTECMNSYYEFLDFILDEKNFATIEKEIADRKIGCVSFYDIVLDYMIMESFDDLENPPSAVKSIASNRWLSEHFREISLQTAVSAVMRRKRSKLIVQDGFFAHFYSILDHLSPVMAWGFLGTDEDLKFKCYSIKESTTALIRDYFSFDRCRYTYVEDLCEDIQRVTNERYWELKNKLTILND